VRLLLLDEPTASLDPDIGDRMRTYLEAYQRRTGCTMLLASHHMGEVERMCDDVIMLREGRVVQRGMLKELLQHPAEPYVRQFIHAQRSLVTEML